MGFADHHCSAKHEGGVDSANRRFAEPQLRTPPWTERLSHGAAILGLSGDDK